jgi:23S rRNA pseudouridine1911/1915/1917 synthase
VPSDQPTLQRLEVTAADAGVRLDAFLRGRLTGHSRSALVELIARGAVRVNGRRPSKGDTLMAGDQVEVALHAAAHGRAPDPALALTVLHEDDWLIAIDKPAGVPSHALRAGESGTIASALLARYPELRGVGYRELEPGLLHRLDTDTSGVLLAARSVEAFSALRALHEAGGIVKTYVALCAGELPAPQTLSAFLDASQRRVRVTTDPSQPGKPITTELIESEPHGDFSLVTLEATFAARHQIRAHLAALGYPIVSDPLYGGPALPNLTRHFLHAAKVSLVHPKTNKRLELTSRLPADLTAALVRSRSS